MYLIIMTEQFLTFLSLVFSLVLIRPNIFTGRNEVVAKVMFLQVSVIHSVHRGVCLSACWDTTLRDQADPPRPGRHPPWDQASPQTRQTPLGPGRPPRTRQTPLPPGPGTAPWDQADPPRPGRPPPPREADSSIRSTSGRYASYWNAYLFIIMTKSLFFLNSTLCFWYLYNFSKESKKSLQHKVTITKVFSFFTVKIVTKWGMNKR